MANKLTATEIQGMVRHWLSTPPNGYLGSGYGTDVMAMLQNPMGAGIGDGFIAKMREDLPIIGALPAGAINVYFEDKGNDSKILWIDVSGSLVGIDSLGVIA